MNFTPVVVFNRGVESAPCPEGGVLTNCFGIHKSDDGTKYVGNSMHHSIGGLWDSRLKIPRPQNINCDFHHRFCASAAL